MSKTEIYNMIPIEEQTFGERFEAEHPNLLPLCPEFYMVSTRKKTEELIKHRDKTHYLNKMYVCPLLYYFEIWFDSVGDINE